MPHGGKRNGAGRQKGSKNGKTRKVAVKAAAEGISPIEVMLFVMRDHYDNNRYAEAAEVAKDAAPYCHPRLGSVTVKGDAKHPLAFVEVASAPANDRGSDGA